MRWFRKNKSDKPAEARSKVNASSPQRPVKGIISNDGYLICPACKSESVYKASAARRWMQEQALDALMCGHCGAYLTLD